MQDWQTWFKNLIATNYFFTKLQNPGEISSPIVQAIKDKEIPVLDPKEVSTPIVEALEAIRDAVDEKEGVEEVTVKNIGEAKADLTEVLAVLKDILNKEEKDIEFPEQKEVEFDTKPIIKALEKIEKSIPKYEQKEVADYTELLSRMCEVMEEPKEKTDLSKIESALESMAKTDDIAVIADWLKTISEKKYPEFPDFPRDKDGIPYFNPTRVGSGGSGNSTTTNAAGEAINPATEETLQAVLAASGGGKATNMYGYQAKSTTASYTYYFYEDSSLNWYIMRKTIATGVMDYTKGTGGYASVYVDSTSAPSGSPTFASYGNTF